MYDRIRNVIALLLDEKEVEAIYGTQSLTLQYLPRESHKGLFAKAVLQFPKNSVQKHHCLLVLFAA